QIITFCEKAKESGLEVALAGKIQWQDIPFLKTSGADIIGVRSIVCSNNNDRINGTVDVNLVKKLKMQIND
ncbi:MAG: (5-formylfuran-3-yl)methyl phosphate synthase, partial [Promethearchaeota archaeon]